MFSREDTPPATIGGSFKTLPFRSEQIGSPECNYDVSVWHCPDNVCECNDWSHCDTATVLYYGSAEDEVTKFCPRHFYEMHAGTGAAYRLLDPDGQRTPRETGAIRFVARLPWVAKVGGEEDDPDRTTFDQAVWRCEANVCELAGRGQGSCDGTGYFYGTGDRTEPKCCARHTFCDPSYTHHDLTDDEMHMAREPEGPTCRSCGSEIVPKENDGVFRGGECEWCEYARYRAHPIVLDCARCLLALIEGLLGDGCELFDDHEPLLGHCRAILQEQNRNFPEHDHEQANG